MNRYKARKLRQKRVRKKVSGNAACPRLTVNRTLKNISVQAIDDQDGKTLFSLSTLSKAFKDKKDCANVKGAKALGKMAAQLAKTKGIEKVVFDRAGFLFHGRIKALADGAREGGLKF
jgi:large subunit ribosomal protein L18